MLAEPLDCQGFQRDGCIRLRAPEPWRQSLEQVAATILLDPGRAGCRNLLELGVVRDLASQIARELSPERPLYAVRALWFDKRPSANWKVPWHQDLSIAVAARSDAPGFGPWSLKQGVVHVQPPLEILESMFAVRLHLDRADASNGALQIVPGSHRRGVLASDEIERASADAVTLEADRGELIVMRPLLLHASSAAQRPRSRRVLHVEYSTLAAPGPLAWHQRISGSPSREAPRRSTSCPAS